MHVGQDHGAPRVVQVAERVGPDAERIARGAASAAHLAKEIGLRRQVRVHLVMQTARNLLGLAGDAHDCDALGAHGDAQEDPCRGHLGKESEKGVRVKPDDANGLLCSPPGHLDAGGAVFDEIVVVRLGHRVVVGDVVGRLVRRVGVLLATISAPLDVKREPLAVVPAVRLLRRVSPQTQTEAARER
jgi:hypothetical protein